MRRALPFLLAAAALFVAAPARAQTTAPTPTVTATTPALNTSAQAQADAEKLATDSAAYNAALNAAGTSQATLNADAAAVDADLSAVSADQGTTQIAITSKKYLMYFGIGGAGGITAAPYDKSYSVGAIAGLDLDFGFGTLASGADHWHVSLVLGATNLSNVGAGKTIAAGAVAILPGYQPALSSPTYSLGPAAYCPVNGQWCVFGVMFSTSLTGTVAKAGFNVPGVPTS